MHIRYKQSCLIIPRHISDRVINKHCKINEEKCDLQFPLIGKALAIARHKVIALGLRTGEGSAARAAVLSTDALTPHPAPPWPGQLGSLSSGLLSLLPGVGSCEGRSRARIIVVATPSLWPGPSALGTGSLVQAPSAHSGSGSPGLWLSVGPPLVPSLFDAACPSEPSVSLPYIVRPQLPPAIFSPFPRSLNRFIQRSEPTPRPAPNLCVCGSGFCWSTSLPKQLSVSSLNHSGFQRDV